MLKLNGTTIYLTRGDTLEILVELKTREGEPYTLSENDTIRFAAKKSYKDEEPIITKDIPKSTMRLRLESNETKEFKARSAPYVYDIEVTFEDGTVDTVIDRAQLYITEEVD